MANSIISVNYDELTQIAKQFHSESEQYTELHAQTRQRAEALRNEWQGDAAQAFFREMDDKLLPSIQRVSGALLSSETVLKQIIQIIHDADEETASYFKGLGSDSILAGASGTAAGTSSGFVYPEWAKNAVKWMFDGKDIAQIATLAKALKNGETFAGQVKIFGPAWYSKNILDLSANLRSIGAENLLQKVSKDNPALLLLKFATDVIPDMFKYTDTSHRIAAIAADALIAGASIAVSNYGMVAGAAIGTALGGPAGTVIGGLAGKFIAGWVTDHVLTTGFNDLIPQMGGVGGAILGSQPGGVGVIGGWNVGSEGGKLVTGLISPDVAKLSVKDIFIEKTADVIDKIGTLINGNQSNASALPQGI